ncbi:MAG: fatty acid desaturase [Pseudomonadota bacterium]
MGEAAAPRKTSSGRSEFEGPTWLVLAGCYSLWLFSLWGLEALGWIAVVPLAIAIALHSSLQHEILHGHPTRNALLNEALISIPMGLFIPYRRFRDLHLRHHRDDRLTDPYDDPESFYQCHSDISQSCGLVRALLAVNATFAGRMLIGPAMAMFAFWTWDLRLFRSGDRRVIDAWMRHLILVSALIWVLYAFGVDGWLYFAAAYLGMSLIMVRSFIEHRADQDVAARTAVVDAHWFWRLLFLNNNFHLVHHDRPSMAWYRLPRYWRAERETIAERNGGYVFPGYGSVAWRWLFRRREPYVHPLTNYGDAPDQGA